MIKANREIHKLVRILEIVATLKYFWKCLVEYSLTILLDSLDLLEIEFIAILNEVHWPLNITLRIDRNPQSKGFINIEICSFCHFKLDI